MDDRNFNEDKLFLIEKLQQLPQYTKPVKCDPLAADQSNTKSSSEVNNKSDNSINTTVIDNCTDQVETESLVLSRSASVLSVSIASTNGDNTAV